MYSIHIRESWIQGPHVTSAIFTKPSPSQSCIENIIALTESVIPRNRESLKNISIVRKITSCHPYPLTLMLFILDERQKVLRSSIVSVVHCSKFRGTLGRGLRRNWIYNRLKMCERKARG